MGIRNKPTPCALLLTILAGACLAPLLSAQDEIDDIYYQLLSLHSSDSLDNAGLTIFPVLNISLGGEQQGFAGAYTSTARDASFLEANPAGSPLQQSTWLNVNTTNIIADVNMESLVYTERFGDLGIGAYLKLLHTMFSAVGAMGETNASATYLETLAGVNVGYAFLRNYYFSGIAVGANLKLAYRHIPGELYAKLDLNGQTQSALGVMGDIGVLTRFNFLKGYSSRDKNFSIGAALMNLGPPVEDEPLPTNARFGISYQPIRPLLIAGDLKIPLNLVDLAKSEVPGFGVATSLQFVKFFNIKGGFYLDNGFPRIALGTHIDLEDIAFDVNYVVDFSSTFNIGDHMSIQASFNMGDNGRSAIEKKVDTYYIDALVALSKSEFAQVIELCELALKLDPRFTPAQETILVARKSLELENQMEKIQLQSGD